MFEEIVGQIFPKKILTNAITENRINHAYIFHGKEGTGRMTTAKKFSQYLICKNKIACMECAQCKQFLAGTVDDFKIIDTMEDKTEILVDQIRELVNDVYIRPRFFEKKIYIVNNADKMNVKAQNAFLKVFEEPPQYAVFILIVSKLSNILQTIRSRGVEVRFSALSKDDMKEIIKRECGKDLPDDIAAVSDGSVKTALSLISNDESALMRDNVIKKFILFLKSHSEADMLELYKVISDNKNDAFMVINLLYTVLTDIVNSGRSDLIKICDTDIKINEKKLYDIFEILQELSIRITTNANYSLMVLDALSRIRVKLI